MAKRYFEQSSFAPLLMLLLAAALSYSDLLWRFDRWIYDAELQLLATPASKEIVIIEVDQKSLNKIGRWPWPRDIHARLLQILASAKPQAIGFDLLFSEADQYNPDPDTQFGKALAATESVVLPVIIEHNGPNFVETLPIPAFSDHAVLGHANVELDKDGVSRSVFLQIGLGTRRWPALALAMFTPHHPEIQQALPGQRVIAAANAENNTLVGDYRVWLPFYDPSSHFSRVSYIDVLSGSIPSQFFHRKYVLVGVTANGIDTSITTPVSTGSQPMSGVDFAAATLDGLLKNTLWQPLPMKWQLFVTLCFVTLSMSICARYSPRWLPLVIAQIAAVILLFSLALLYFAGFWFAPAAILFVLLLGYPLRSWGQFEKLIHSLFVERKLAYITLNSIVDAVITTNAEGFIDYMNPAALNLLDNSLPRLPRLNVDQVFCVAVNEHRYKLGELIRQSITHHEPVKFPACEVSILDRQSMTANLVVAPLFAKGGNLIGSVLTINGVENIVIRKHRSNSTSRASDSPPD